MRGERWSSTNEVENNLASLDDSNYGGLVLHTAGGENYGYVNEGHQIIIGVSGCGKSRRGTIPQTRSLIESGESLIIVDPKGEIYRNTACYARKSHKIHVVNFREPGNTECWNPLAYPFELYARDEKALSQQMNQEIVRNLLKDHRSNDQFWINSQRNLLAGLVNMLVQYAPKEHCNFAEIINILTQDWESLSNDGTTVKGGLLEKVVKALPINLPAKHLLASYTSLNALVTRSCVMSEVVNTIADFCTTEEITSMTSNDDLNIANMDGEEPFAVYIILPDESEIFNVLSGLLVSQLTNHFIRLADKDHAGKLPRRVNIVIEELGNVGGSISNLPHLMSASRSRNIRLTLVLQSLSQLYTLYAPSKAETILANADVWMAFRTSNWETLKTLSKQCGERKMKAGDAVSYQPLINPTQLGAMKTGQALVLVSGRTRFITQLPDYTKMFDCDDLTEVPLPQTQIRNNHEPLQLDDLANIISGNAIIHKRLESEYKKMFKGG